MSKKYKFNRQKSDYVLTDLLPYEKGNHFTHRYFYEYLQNNKKTLNSLYSSISSSSKSFDAKWHSSPLSFFISKKNNGFREIFFMNPLALIESLAFIKLFENDLLNISHNKESFSTRKASRTNTLNYKKNKNQTVYYTNEPHSKKQLLISLESSGTYFNHSPFKTITDLLNSKRFGYFRDRFEHLLKIDVQDCFPSIYTHSFKWLITNKGYDSKNLKDENSIYNNIDRYLQNINGSKTNGIIVGPEISRLLAEFLFVHIDDKLIQILGTQKIINKKDFKIFRFVDDYYIFADDTSILEKIRIELTKLLNDFQLKLNQSKISKYHKSDTLNKWFFEISSIINDINNIFDVNDNFLLNLKTEHTEQETIFKQTLLEVASSIEKELIKRNRIRFIKYENIKGKVNLALQATNETTLIPSYILSTILRKVEMYKDQNDFNINMDINQFISLIIFIYSKDVSYSSTQKVIRTLSLLLERDIKELRELIVNSISKFEKDIFTKYPADWSDLLLFFSSYQLDISKKLLDNISSIILEEENPCTLASLSLLVESPYISSTVIVKKINEVIKKKIENLNWDSFFEDKLSWWVFIFYSYPKLNRKIKSEIKYNLNIIKVNSHRNPSQQAKNLIIDFLLQNDRHFIEWGFTKDNYYQQYFFYTKDRTVFNPTVIDQINLSR